MSTQFSRLQIINAALLSQGQTELANENDGSLEWRTLAANWPQIVEGEMEDASLRHNIVEQQISSRTGAGRFGFPDRYWTPSTAIHVKRVFTEDASGERCYLDDWYQDAKHINVDAANGIWAEMIEAVDPEDFSVNFVTGVQKRLEAVICRALKEEHGLADRMEQEAQFHFQRARTASSKAKGPRPVFRKDSVFSRARFRRG